jgi:hypothetical protein
MPRIRSIHPEACTSEKLARCDGDEERCYWRLQTHCDDEGRCEDNPRLIWAALFPLHENVGPTDVDRWLSGLAREELIFRYEVACRRYLCVSGFAEKQRPRHPTASKLPPMPEACGDLPQRNHSPDAGVGVGDGDGVGGRKRRPTDDFAPTPEHVDYCRLHGLDVGAEKTKWITHCEANGKTYERVNAGFTTWLHKAVDFGRGGKPAPISYEFVD